MKSNYFGFLVFFVLVGILTTSCKKGANPPLEPNTWIESANRTDTIVFKDNFLILNRSKETSGGYLLPKIGSGPYSFKELKDSIGLMHSVSSLYKFTNYPFKIENNTLFIGDFYNKSGKLLVFKKLR